MILVLSSVSSQALWLLLSADGREVLGETSWQDDQSYDLSAQIAPRLDALLLSAGVRKHEIGQLWGVSGPGAFTGLRVSGAFLQGLARALGAPLFGLPTFDLVGSPFFIPLQPQKARAMDRAESLAGSLEFLHIQSAQEFIVSRPGETDLILGLRENARWPTPSQLHGAVRAKLASSPKFQIEYGLNPKIYGQR